MINGRANNRKPESHVNPAFEIEKLKWDVALVVIHTHDGVVLLPLHREVEQRVRSQGTFDGNAFLPRGFNCRPDFLYFLITEQPILTCMRVQTSHCNPGVGVKSAHCCSCQLDYLKDSISLRAGNGRFQGHVCAHMSNDELI